MYDNMFALTKKDTTDFLVFFFSFCL
uniref:Uncharacterized protein n=1 Tax=Anguilla anguilla TaxID=7936 RepID=A0A0E9RF96_ANGAN